jgi:proteasome accessory factor B
MRNEALHRQLRIIHLIYNHRIQGISKQQLADEFNVSKRTIARDITNLSTSGFPITDDIDMDRGGQVFYYMWYKYKVPEISFSFPELLVIYLLYKVYTPLNPFLHESFTNVIDKISSTIPPESKNFLSKLQKTFLPDLHPLIKDDDPEKIILISDAIIQNRKVHFKYISLKKEKIFNVTPLGMKFYHNNFYLAAYYKKRDVVLTFALNRMDDITIATEKADEIDFDVNTFFHEGFGFYHGDTFNVKFQFSSEVKQIIKERTWHPEQKIIEHKDGSVTLEMPASNLSEMMWFALSYGSNVKVLEPEELKNIVLQELSKINELYI